MGCGSSMLAWSTVCKTCSAAAWACRRLGFSPTAASLHLLCGESAGLAPRSAATRLRCWPSRRQFVSPTPLFSAGLKLSDGRAGHNRGERSTRRRSRTCSGARGREAAPRRRAALSAKNTGAAANRACSRPAEQSASFPAMRLAISGTRSSERASSRLRPHDAELARFACSPPSQPSQKLEPKRLDPLDKLPFSQKQLHVEK